MIRRLPMSALFPYTTLFRSTERRVGERGRVGVAVGNDGRDARLGREAVEAMLVQREHGARADAADPDGARPALRPARSEEHTSELQSRENLVCRLLLEKKKA